MPPNLLATSSFPPPAISLTERHSGAVSSVAPEPKDRVLVVDDEPSVRDALARQLRQRGYQVDTACDGKQALALVRDHSYGVVLSDISMPGMDGIDLLQEIRRYDINLPVVIVTGQPAWETATQALDHRAFKYLPKPLRAEELFDTVERAVACRRMSDVRKLVSEIPGMPPHQIADMTALEVRFTSALEKLFVVYQPIVRWPSGQVVGYEVLMRSRESSIPHPGVLLDAAERLQRLRDLGRRVRGLAVERIAEVPEGVKLFVNLHTQDLLDPELYDPNSELGRVADRVVLELTERAKLEQVTDVAVRVAKLRDMGFTLAIDDLGAGYAGLTSFAQLEPEVVKLDMALVRDVDASKTKQRLIGLLNALCEELGMTVVAEGIETVAERDMLASLGCTWMQGFLFARPAEDFERPDMG